MLPYWVLFALTAWIAINSQRGVLSSRRWSTLWQIFFLLLVLMIGLRHNVGGDWGSYFKKLESLRYLSLERVISKESIEIGYSLMNLMAIDTGLDIYFVNFCCSIIFAWGLIEFSRAQPRPWLAVVVAVPYLVIVVAMGYTRQGAAIGFGMLGMVALTNSKLFRFMLFVALAASFHKSAVLLVPLAALSNPRSKVWNISWALVFSVLFYSVFLESSVETLQRSYLEARYMSAGAAIRVWMNAVPAVLFFSFRARFALKSDRLFWTSMAALALFFVVLLQVSSSSTAIDRVGLYLIPLQLFVLSRLPEVFGKSNGNNQIFVLGVVFYSALVQFVWLFFAVNVNYWLPYQFYPLFLLLQ